MSAAAGMLHGVGLGPGDPDLMTLRAHRLISAARVVVYPAPEGGESFARSIAADAIPAGAEEIRIDIPMRVERFPAQDVYEAASRRIAERLDQGLDVVVLCEGDPLFYGSFMFLFARLAGRYRTEITPGVASLAACAAAARLPLCARNEPLAVIPGPLADAALGDQLRGGGAAAILKVGRHLPRLKRILGELGLAERATFVAHASLPQQVVAPLLDAPEPAPYFSMILIQGADPYAAV